MRDLALLEAACARPVNRAAYGEADLHLPAAAYAFGICKAHAFVDGNKRVAFFATDVFLRLNGYKLKVEAKKAHRFLIGLLENDRCNFDELLPWIRKHAIEI